MSKKVLRTGLAIAAVGAMFVPGLGTVAALGLKVGVGALLSTGIALGSALLLKPKRPRHLGHAQERLHATLRTDAPRKIVFGRTAMATDVLYSAYTGTSQEYLDQIVCVASHEVEAIEEIWLDSELAWSASGGVASKYSGYLQIDIRNPGTSSNGIAIDSVWTSACTLTGCAYYRARYKLSGNSKKAESPFAQGVTNRVTVRGKGAKVYDPRLDSTVPGGSGPQRADNQATWAWSTSGVESGRNPPLQRLFYLLGWKINGKLAVGRGVPPARQDLVSYIDAANICDEAVSKPGGGTEPRYRGDGVVSEADAPATVLTSINAAMNAVPTEDGGKIGVYIQRDDLSDPGIITLTDDDLADPAEESWLPFRPIHEMVNAIRGTYVDPSNAALYQPVDAPAVTLPGPDSGSLDGIQRIEPFDLEMVQSGSQWQRLATLRLNRTQIAGVYSANFKARAWATRMWRPVRFTHRGLRFSNKLFRVIHQALPVAGVVRLTLREEGAELYSATAVGGLTVAAAPTAYNPLNNPLVAHLNTIAEGAGTTVDLTAFVGTMTIAGNKAAGLAFGSGGATPYARTAQRYKGPVSATGTLAGVGTGIGVSSRATPTGATQVDILLYALNATTYRVYRDLVFNQDIALAPAPGDVARVVLDEVSASFEINGVAAGTAIALPSGLIGQSWRGIVASNPVTAPAAPLIVTFDFKPGAVKAEPNADVTATHVPKLQLPGSIEIAANSANATTTPLPLTVRVVAWEGSTNRSTTTSFVLGNLPPGVAATINNTSGSAGRGVISVSQADASGAIPVTATIPGHAPIIEQIPLIRAVAGVAQTGGAGAPSVTDTSFETVVSATHARVSDQMTVRSKSDGTLRFSASATFRGFTTADHNLAVKARYSPDGGATSFDFAAETGGSPTENDADAGFANGYVSIPETTKSGLAANADFLVWLEARRTLGSASVSFQTANFTVRQ